MPSTERVAAAAVGETVKQIDTLGVSALVTLSDDDPAGVPVGGAPVADTVTVGVMSAPVDDAHADGDEPKEAVAMPDADAPADAVTDAVSVALRLTGSVPVLHGDAVKLKHPVGVVHVDGDGPPEIDALAITDELATRLADADAEPDGTPEPDAERDDVAAPVSERNIDRVIRRLPLATADCDVFRLAEDALDGEATALPVLLLIPLDFDTAEPDAAPDEEDIKLGEPR